MNWEEHDRLRRLVPVRVDQLLDNWARWARRYRYTAGHRSSSAGFISGNIASVEDLEDEVDAWQANVADAVIDTLPIDARNAIAAVYAGSAWRLRSDLLGATLATAAGEFMRRARQRGLV